MDSNVFIDENSKIVELPYIGTMEDDISEGSNADIAIKAKLWLKILPPEDPNALEKVLEKMVSSKENIEKLKLLEKVDFKNYIHTDESLRLTALLFPSIQQINFEGNFLTIRGVEYIAKSCQKLKFIEFYICENLNMENVFRLFNTEEHKMNLRRIFLFTGQPTLSRNFSIEEYLPFMARCERCGSFFNKRKNEEETLCLYGGYANHGAYRCCGSDKPSYLSTSGCQSTYHTTSPISSTLDLNDPNTMFTIVDHQKNTLLYRDRRALHKSYEKWNIKRQQDQ
ncbi:unnamed protein product [Rotaria sordida]|uniref:Uncharacterized protein n=1 Tax=Rotaria sordida TaxID=392033 RepID=A0A815PC80_9BILA|nr:unnamed protein product [Rotaria sordida]CAF4097879.1 unnamed protein product [Rotaria sordida]